ncbi:MULTISPECIES: PHP domain-containing protein [unclassified Streptomyces]|uniref:PHP domain-containing protein n=1 Tax=unclassified Streptomyces TaxID=2593676 RepID=UPI002DDBD581|nr:MULTISPECIES: PHP domain-containing protein [unclassified Streptomyces]WSA92514.1 PHP domain-containing protein [Streptomyces sp. NBC_01795]WSB76881.1 PHP domain-containing protein [Streptomyces sp. NBC_01775]WSS14846.1 PHP domain-containing protein [Streptomyces sp. NBC_01186]WSS43680.1 PHP domain-containing protein [Streptomyces sp. NBC_01187]
MRIDLHTHSTASDGTDTPAELVRNAAAAGLDVIALTDHDTVAGHPEAMAALPAGLTLVRGAELSCRLDGISLHMLAYLFDPAEPELARERELVRDDRVPRARAIVAKLEELGVPVTWEQVARIAGDGTVGRPHIAAAMVEAGVVETVSDAFTEEWIANDGRAYVGKHELNPFDALRLIKGAGGVAVFAHPLAAKRGQCVPESAIAELAEAGLDGVEADHADHEPATRARLHALAADLGILATGSSDYHGSRKNIELGELTTAPDVYAEIAARASGPGPVTG